MDECIYREKVIELVLEWYKKACGPKNMSSYNMGERAAYIRTISEIIELPAADVRPVVRGKWIKHNATHIQKGGMYLECSCCHEYITVLGHVFAYCPNCGADLREPPKEE